ncbi:unnamed protein product [Cuscuta europaea]|uniref:Protein kinase domain-containing protein n=1 Tax=Cuscuta europaea TaxID=41803 RepID=A0A9P1DW47_CUSEU|nr:unnamed protein product [Cuscuta europaea]
MADPSSVDVILDFLRRNKFTRAEAALQSELSGRPDLIGVLQKLALEDSNGFNPPLEEANGNCRSSGSIDKEISSRSSRDNLKELIVNGPDYKLKNVVCAKDQSNANESILQSSMDAANELNSRKYNPTISPFIFHQSDGECMGNTFSGFPVSGKTMSSPSDGHENSGKAAEKSGGDGYSFSNEIRTWPGSTSKSTLETKQEKSHYSELKEVDQSHKKARSKDAFGDKPWNDCMVKTVFPFLKEDVSNYCDRSTVMGDKKEEKRQPCISDIKTANREQCDDIERTSYFGRSLGSEPKDLTCFDFPLTSGNQKEEMPRLPPVRLKSEEKSFNIHWVEKFERDGDDSRIANSDKSYHIGSFLDVPVGQETNQSGKRPPGGSWLSVSQGIAEDTSDLVSGFATIGDGINDAVDYPNEYWDSDEYDDEDDVGYTRQPIEDETWFLAHEIDYPSDNEKGTGHGSAPDPQRNKNREDDEQSFVEEDSYFSGERYIPSENVDHVRPSDDPRDLAVNEMYGRPNDFISQYDGHLMDDDELNFIRSEPVWQGFVTKTNDLVMLGDGKVLNERRRTYLDELCMDDDQHGSVRSIGVGISSDVADIGSEVRGSLVGGSIDGDMEYFQDNDVGGIGGLTRLILHDSDKVFCKKIANHSSDKFITGVDRRKSHPDGGFSFPPPRNGQSVQTMSNKYLLSKEGSSFIATDDINDCLEENDHMLVPWRRKSTDSSPDESSKCENNVVGSANSSPSSLSNYGYAEPECGKKEHDTQIIAREEDLRVSLEDEEAAAVQEQVRQIKAQEEEFETFDLKIVHRKNRTGFEEDKNFHVVLNSVIAGRYHVTEYLGSAAFSKAIQAHDLHTGMDVCVKIIKNNKDFFDQSLDEIKLLKFVNKHDPADKYHILRLYDYFYYREHLLIVCELLKANLYEFHKFNRESGGEVYFTMPRLQSITIQCLEALQYLHRLGLIHCDLKPENILVKSYSRCEVKVIDLGSSCFETDHLCSYVQSRSYRAPEVILGLPYDKKIDIWSLGCILAELCTGNVLFQNESPATLLARVIGIIAPIDQEMLAKGKDVFKYFTKNHMLYEKNQETDRLEYLIPKKSSLRHRLPMGDQGFIDFLTHLLEINPKKRPSASEALKHPWLSYPYEPISS